MNKVILTGRFTADPEIRYSQAEKPVAVAGWSLAVNRRFKSENGPDVDFIQCRAFGKQAEFVEKYFHKGSKADIVGRIQTGSYTNKDGVKVYTTEVVVEEIEFGESKNHANNSNETETPATTPSAEPKPQPASNDGFVNIPDEVEDVGLPFNF